jgi:cytochrome P450
MALDQRPDAPLPVAVRPPDRPLGPWGTWRTVRRNVLELVPEAAYREPILSGGRWPGWHMIMDPGLMEQVLKKREENYPRSRVTLRILKPTEGESIFTAYGASWLRQHKAMAPVFQPRHITGVVPVMTEAAEAASARMAAEPGERDVYADMIEASCDVVCDTALSGRESVDRAALAGAVSRYLASVAQVSLLDLLGAPNWVPRPAALLDRDGPRMDAMMDRIIAARLARGPGATPDVLDLMIAAQDPETGDGLDRIELRNNLLGLLAAGHETTALALTWALYLVAHDREVQLRARAEAQDALGDRAAGADDLARLGYVKQIVQEAMRLYPPVGLMTRTARTEDTLAGRPVRPGQTVILPLYALHRNRLVWDDPDRFDPDRFAPERARARHRFAYLPFGAGPRICIGMAFAYVETVVILATLLARFDFREVEGFAPRPEMILTLRPRGGLRLRVARL